MSGKRVSIIVAACGAAVGSGAAVNAQPFLINQSGATLLENFLKSPASTNDYIDVDGNGIARKFGSNQQLAPFGLPFANGQWWINQDRSVGSVNGFQELVDFGQTFVTTADGVDLRSTVATAAYSNRNKYITNGVPSTEIFNAANPGGSPVRSLMDGSYLATYSAPGIPSDGGIQIDMAPIDVAASWAVFQAGDADFTRLPATEGYGYNPRIPLNKDGTETGYTNRLADLKGKNLFDPDHPENADENTIFDSAICFAPIAVVTNLGTGMQEIDQSNVQHAFTTGRLVSGENLVIVTRDSGSGTRNGFSNTGCIDPSWSIGDNIGNLSVLAEESVLGSKYIPTNKGSNGVIEPTVINTRLAISYVGAERGVNNSWLTGGKMEILAVRNDVGGGTVYSRPNIDAILDNTVNGYNLGGPAVYSTFGDPRSAPVAKGGDLDNNHPDMRNVEAAAFLNNVTRSVAAFEGDPGGDATLFTPGEFLATQFILVDATDNIHNPVNPCDLISNPGLNQNLQDFTRANNVLKNPAYYSFGSATFDGKVPARLTGVVYTDGVANGDFYKDQAGNLISYGANLKSRNRIAADFNGDGLRNLNDAAELVKAWQDRNGGPAWNAPSGSGDIAGAPGSDAIIEVLGDFDGDGNFDKADVRYWADGLAIDPATGNLDRTAGFKAIDDAFGGDFFGASWADGRDYQNGDARFDVSGLGSKHTPGFAPIGQDGVIDQSDIDFVKAQFIGNAYVNDGAANWDNLAEAVGFDLSGDVTGDLIVNQADVDAFTGNGNDCYPDFTGDGALDLFDFLAFVNAFNAQDAAADCVKDGSYDLFDFLCFVNAFNAGC